MVLLPIEYVLLIFARIVWETRYCIKFDLFIVSNAYYVQYDMNARMLEWRYRWWMEAFAIIIDVTIAVNKNCFRLLRGMEHTTCLASNLSHHLISHGNRNHFSSGTVVAKRNNTGNTDNDSSNGMFRWVSCCRKSWNNFLAIVFCCLIFGFNFMQILCIAPVIEWWAFQSILTQFNASILNSSEISTSKLISNLYEIDAEFHRVFLCVMYWFYYGTRNSMKWKSCRFHVCGNVRHTLICTHASTHMFAIVRNIIKVIYYVCVINLNAAFSPVCRHIQHRFACSDTSKLYNIQHLFTPANNGQAAHDPCIGQMSTRWTGKCICPSSHCIFQLHFGRQISINLMYNLKYVKEANINTC